MIGDRGAWKRGYFVMIMWLCSIGLSGFSQTAKGTYEVMFYNVENLFDTIDQPGVMDEEFTPTGSKQWNGVRYREKLEHLARVISRDGQALPAVVGLCEVENKSVLEDLIATEALKDGKYAIVHEDSRDGRGIDVALIYQPKYFRYIQHRYLKVAFSDTTERPTRDILHVVGTIGKRDTLHLFVNHWPSRYGGEEKSEPKRIAAAETLRKTLDELLYKNVQAKIIVMGDFNDYPDNISMREVLSAQPWDEQSEPQFMINLAYSLQVQDQGANGSTQKSEQGSYNYKGHWGFLDQMVVSPNLLQAKKGVYAGYRWFQPVKLDWMLYTDPKYGDQKPNRSFSGDTYHGGYSDHLPVVCTLQTR